jgi:hypothetical protein
MIENSRPSAPAIIASVKKLVARDQTKLASELVEKHRPSLLAEPEFQAAWARLIIKRRDSTQAKELVESKDFRPAKLQAEDPLVYIRLLSLSGQTEELSAALRTALEQALAEREISSTLMEIGAVFFELGKQDVFKRRVQEVLPKPMAEHLFDMFSRRGKGLGFDLFHSH